MKERIGFIGLGLMGRPMSVNILKAGYPLTVYTRTRSKIEDMVARGARGAASAKEVARNSDIVVTMLPDTAVVEEVVLGEDGVLDGMAPGSMLIDMSSISPTGAKRIAASLVDKGVEMLDAPVSGGDVGAAEASLSIMVGGKPEAFERALPLFKVMGKNITLVGGYGAGQVTKACNQIIVGITIEAVAEALVFAKKNGVDPAKARDALMGGFAQSRILELHGQRMLDRNFKPGGKVASHKKDTDIALAVAKEIGVYLPGTSMIAQLWNSITALGGLEWDHSSLIRALEALSGVEVVPG